MRTSLDNAPSSACLASSSRWGAAGGALLWRREGVLRQAGFVVDAVDTTGAGDVFCGVFTAGLARGAEDRDALREAVAASALACTRIGAQSGTPTRDALAAFLEQYAAHHG